MAEIDHRNGFGSATEVKAKAETARESRDEWKLRAVSDRRETSCRKGK